MDLLHRRYADPFVLVDNMILAREFDVFPGYLISKDAEEKNDRLLWEFYLHKVEGKSYNDFLEGIKSSASSQGVINEARKNEIIEKSAQILRAFSGKR